MPDCYVQISIKLWKKVSSAAFFLPFTLRLHYTFFYTMKPPYSLIHFIINRALSGAGKQFISSTDKVAKIQETLLLETIRRNENSDFGRAYSFASITDIESFKKNVPISTYQDYQNRIVQMKTRDNGILTEENTLLFEPTSGSKSGSKLIPYTRSLKNEFTRAVNVWLYDIYKQYPGVKKGSHYWSISPVLEEKTFFETSIPIGFEDDSDYLGVVGKFINTIFTVPSEIKKISRMEDFQYITSCFLMNEQSLSLVSVWNPRFFTLLLDCIFQNHERIIRDIFDGTLSVQEKSPKLVALFKKDRRRARELERIFSRGDDKQDILHHIWPHLILISAWADGYSKQGAKLVADLFPHVVYQPKGLISTEGMVSFPLTEAGGSIPAYMSHFLEFLPIGEETKSVAIHELEVGKRYSVVMTTGGGFYRYRLGDIIEVTNRWRGLPVITFISREATFDLVGEKLSEDFVKLSLQKVSAMMNVQPSFKLFTPNMEKEPYFYTLFIELSGEKHNVNILPKMREAMEIALCENYHYRYARSLGQLGEIRLFHVTRDGEQQFINRFLSEGKRLGDIKPLFFDARQDWDTYFTGNFI